MKKFFSPSSDNSSINKRRLMTLIKWIIYTLLMLLTFSLMQTPGLFSISGIRPLILFPFAIILSMYEKEMAGGIFAIVTGIVWGTSSTLLFGFHAIVLFICCVICGVITRYYLQTALTTGFLLVFLSLCFFSAIEFYFRYYIWNYNGLLVILKDYYLPTILYTTLTTPVFYYLIKFISTNVKIDLNPSEPMEER